MALESLIRARLLWKQGFLWDFSFHQQQHRKPESQAHRSPGEAGDAGSPWAPPHCLERALRRPPESLPSPLLPWLSLSPARVILWWIRGVPPLCLTPLLVPIPLGLSSSQTPSTRSLPPTAPLSLGKGCGSICDLLSPLSSQLLPLPDHFKSLLCPCTSHSFPRPEMPYLIRTLIHPTKPNLTGPSSSANLTFK